MQLQPGNWVLDCPQTEHLAQITDERGASLAPVPQLIRLQLQAVLVVKGAGISSLTEQSVTLPGVVEVT